MKSQSDPANRAVQKTPTTKAIVSKVQSITAKKNDGCQAGWVSNLQRTADNLLRPTAPAALGRKSAQLRSSEGVKSESVAAKGGKQDDQSGRAARLRPMTTASRNKGDPDNDNHSNQRNPNHEQFYKSRGLHNRPSNWKGPIATATDPLRLGSSKPSQ